MYDTFQKEECQAECGVKKEPEPVVIVNKELNDDANKHKQLFITDHTDSTGTGAFNATLSIKRASSVRAKFISNNVYPKRISIDSMGKIAPLATNETGKGREKIDVLLLS